MPITDIIDSAGQKHPLADLSNYHDLPHDLALALVEERAERAVPSASVLTGCVRRFELERRVDYAVDPRKRLAAYVGTAIHASLADNPYRPHRVRCEVSTSATVKLGDDLPEPYREVTLTGTTDYYDEDAGLLRDWKTKAYLPAGFTPTPAHIFQVNVYHWLLVRGTGASPVCRLELVYLDQRNVSAFALEPWPLDTVEDRIRAVLRGWALARVAGKLPNVVEGFTQQGRPSAPCSYCDLLSHCRQVRLEEEGQ